MSRVRLLGTALLLVGLLLPVSLTAQERGISPTEIVIGSTLPLSGPAAYWGTGVGGGVDAFLRSVNDAGGEHGPKFRVVLRDDSFLPPRAVLNALELVERDGVFAIVGMIGTANAFAARDYIAESKTLWISPTTNDIFAGWRNRKYLFVTYPSYLNEGRILTQYAADKLGTKKIAVFYQNDEYGLGLLRGVKYGLATARGVKLVGQASYEVTDADVSAQAVKLRASGADTVFIAATPGQGALIVREMTKLGWRTTLLAGVPFVEPLVEALRRAGPDVTKDKVVTALESLRNWNGEVSRAVTFGPDRHQGLNRIYIVKSSGGKYVKITDWITYPTQY